jgi:chemotaxis protein methyltransferase CheR
VTEPWNAVADFVHTATGLAFPAGRRRILEDGCVQTMRAHRCRDPDAFLGRLHAEPELFDDLVSAITIGETYFFRHAEQLAVIRDVILPDLLASVRDRPLRIWSAGCATGEEPYTLAILAHEAGIANRVHIVATDISRQALRLARVARFREWSLRGTPAAMRERYFERREEGYELVPRIRDLVEFRYLNLAADAYPALSTATWGMDLVLCRNVLIYFDAASAAAVASRLLESSSECGWLVLGASDPLLEGRLDVDVVATAAGLVYRRKGRSGTSPPAAPAVAIARPHPRPIVTAAAPPPPQPSQPPQAPQPRQSPTQAPPRGREVEPPLADAARERYAARDYERAAELSAQAVEGGTVDPAAWIVLVRSLANLGRTVAAARYCAAAPEDPAIAAERAYLEATLLVQLDRGEEAMRAARHALYLDRSFVMAHFALGDALARSGDREGARRSYRNAHELLAGLPPASPVPAADGEPAGRLRLLAATQLKLLEGAA